MKSTHPDHSENDKGWFDTPVSVNRYVVRYISNGKQNVISLLINKQHHKLAGIKLCLALVLAS